MYIFGHKLLTLFFSNKHENNILSENKHKKLPDPNESDKDIFKS